MNKIYTDSKKKINVCHNISIRIFRLTKAVIRLKEIIRLEEIDKRIKTKVNNVRRLKNLVSSQGSLIYSAKIFKTISNINIRCKARSFHQVQTNYKRGVAIVKHQKTREFIICVIFVKSKLMLYLLLHQKRKSREIETRLIKKRALIITGNTKIRVFQANKAQIDLGTTKNLKHPRSLLLRPPSQMGQIAKEIKVESINKKRIRGTTGSPEYPLQK